MTINIIPGQVHVWTRIMETDIKTISVIHCQVLTQGMNLKLKPMNVMPGQALTKRIDIKIMPNNTIDKRNGHKNGACQCNV